MLRLLVPLTLVLAPMAAEAAATPYPCYWVRGRLMAYNGTPTFRIWPRGTQRLLGVTDAKDGEAPALPRSVAEALGANAFDREVWGEFRVCPLAPDRRGRMRPVRLVDARGLATADYGASRKANP